MKEPKFIYKLRAKYAQKKFKTLTRARRIKELQKIIADADRDGFYVKLVRAYGKKLH